MLDVFLAMISIGFLRRNLRCPIRRRLSCLSFWRNIWVSLPHIR